MVDAIKRTLKVPPKFVPYLEKHRIYELFYELTEELLIKKPEDHIFVLKQILNDIISKFRDGSKIIIISSPQFDKENLTDRISQNIGVIPVKLHLNVTLKNQDPDTVAQYACKLLKSSPYRNLGWILFDYPSTRQEALALQRTGLLPTHVILLVSSSLEDEIAGSKAANASKIPSVLQKYQTNLLGLMAAYKSMLTVCKINGRSTEQLAFDLTKILRNFPHRGAPMLPRVLILGAHGSGHKSQARLLSQRFFLVVVDIEDILKQATLEDKLNSEHIKLLVKNGMPIYADILAPLVERRLMMQDCLDRGWVLTGYPRNVEDFKALDLMPTPPNRVIFLNVDYNVCCERLSERRINMYTGTVHHLWDKPPSPEKRHQLTVHPRDYRCLVIEQISQYDVEQEKMKNYCARTAIEIDGNLSMHTVAELVQAVVVRPIPAEPPRVPRIFSDNNKRCLCTERFCLRNK